MLEQKAGLGENFSPHFESSIEKPASSPDAWVPKGTNNYSPFETGDHAGDATQHSENCDS